MRKAEDDEDFCSIVDGKVEMRFAFTNKFVDAITLALLFISFCANPQLHTPQNTKYNIVMMTDHGQTPPDYQQSDELLKRSLDLIVSVWLSSTNVTTLVQPKLHVVSSCITGMPPSRKRSLAVQAYGSGDVVVPCFSFDDTTTVAELVEVVLQHVRMEQPDGRLMVDKLIFGRNNNEVVFNGHETSGRIVNYGIADNAIGFVILMEAEKMLAKREWSHHVCNVCEDTSQ